MPSITRVRQVLADAHACNEDASLRAARVRQSRHAGLYKVYQGEVVDNWK